MRRLSVLVACLLPVLPAEARAAEVLVAVAANFAPVAERLAESFAAESGHEVSISSGSSGQLFAQIAQGAPFEVFLSADVARPQAAVEAGLAVADTAFVYAVGKLVLLSPSLDMSDGPAVLEGSFSKLAIADPETAPYGAAAREVIAGLGLTDRLSSRLVVGESIAQAFQFVETGNAELGFVAGSQVLDRDASRLWSVPAALHAPIEQGAVLLNPGRHAPEALAFMAFLASEPAKAVIAAAGYATSAR